jgi:hypothetical protein
MIDPQLPSNRGNRRIVENLHQVGSAREEHEGRERRDWGGQRSGREGELKRSSKKGSVEDSRKRDLLLQQKTCLSECKTPWWYHGLAQRWPK